MVANEEAVKYLEIPDKSENDNKLYKTLLFGNGLRVLLVSDPSPVPHDGMTTSSESTGDSCAEESNSGDEHNSASSTTTESKATDTETESDSEEGDEKLAAVALLVDVGSFAEPSQYQGMAHFLEHMIFMGSEKYPNENAFDAHIKKCGGFDNANTDSEETVFYFEVAEENLDSSLDYFTALFKAPLMLKDAMTRERNAVESEFQQTVQDDEARRDQLFASLANKNYPQSTFAWGNLKSLQEDLDDDELHKALHDFCKRHYSANRMYVCIQARLPIDELECLALKHFADIPSNHLQGEDFTQLDYRQAFTEQFHNEVFFVKPVENICKLELSWILPSMRQYYKCKPDHFLSYLMGYEGEGSLCAYLRKRLWGLELLAGVGDTGFDNNSIYTLFYICIYLTDSGFEHLDEVLAATFAFIKLFANCGSLKETYEELQNIEATSFRFAPQKPAFDNVQNLVLKAKWYPPKDILTGNDIYYEYDEQQIQDVIKLLNEFNFNIMITSEKKYNGIHYDKREKWFGTEYTTIPMPEKWIELWEKSEPMMELHLPKPNNFITNDFRLLWEDAGRPEIPMPPKKLLQTGVCELWFRQDDRFLLPEACMYFNFISPLIYKEASFAVMCTLYTELVKYCLAETLYPATVVGLDYDLEACDRGIVLKIDGYNEKLHLLVDIIIKAMISIEKHITEEQLNVFKDQQKKIYFNKLIKPRTLNKDVRLSIIENVHWPLIGKYRELDNITYEDIIKFANTFPAEMYIQTLMQGNLTEEMAHNVMNSVLTTLNCTVISERSFIENRTVKLPIGSHFIRCNALNDKDCNTIVTNFYQIGPNTLRLQSILDLLMMFVEEPLFDTLRTKEQLGYTVAAALRLNYGIVGYTIMVNSQEGKYSADHVEQRIEAFRGKIIDILEAVTQSEYDHVRESLIKMKQVVDMSLNEEVNRNWCEIVTGDYIFDRRRKFVEILRTLTKQDIIDFCVQNERDNFRKLSIQVIGNVQPGDKIQGDSPDNTKQDDNNEDSDDSEELFNTLANRLNLLFIERADDETSISNLLEFKQTLDVYPVTRTNIDGILIIAAGDNACC